MNCRKFCFAAFAAFVAGLTSPLWAAEVTEAVAKEAVVKEFRI